MANIAIFRINYKSDFILTLNSDAGWATPFCIKFWTGAPSQAYFVGFDGKTYTHCAPVDGEPTKLLVQFDDHHLPIGDLKFQIAYHFTVDDFPTSMEDEVINQASVIIEVDGEPAQVMLDLNGETAPEIQFSLPAYANEAQRIANEQARIAAEQQRIANEEARIAAETVRQQNEEQRIQHEEERVSDFARLKRESEAATTDANTAATLANEEAALAADKATLAQAAATLADEKAALAADKAALAQAAATLANEKAALAQQKAAYAQAQGDYANAQGDYAKEQGDYANEQGDYAKEQGTIAEEDHVRAESDHTRAESDHATAANDHTQAASDHTRAEVDHSTASTDHTTATNDHTQAVTDHATATSDHTQAGNDHTRAESDHTRAESDHAAVEVYVDSLGAFDISAYHATGGVLAKYADLTAALGTNGANIPDTLRKGGISVKFVQSSDNKYVQYRCVANEFTNDTTKWAIYSESVYVENSEFIEVKTDKEDKILEATKADGTKVIGGDLQVEGNIINEGIQEQIDSAVESMQQTITDNLFYIDNIVNNPDNTTPHGYLSEQSNPEWLQVTTDSEGRVLGGRKHDGTVVENCDVKVEKVSINGVTAYTSEDIEGRFEVKTDADGKILEERRDNNSIKREFVGFESPQIITDNIILTKTGINNFKNTLEEIGVDTKDTKDFHEDLTKALNMPIPHPIKENGKELYSDLSTYNVERKASRCRFIRWNSLAPIPKCIVGQDSYFPVGEITGIPYSSAMEWDKIVGYDLSFVTYLTASNNPYSMLYTENPRNNGSVYGFNYHQPARGTVAGWAGIVCNILCNYCTGMDIPYDTGMFKYLASIGKFVEVYPQNAQGLRIGDILWQDGHARLVQNVWRDSNGLVQKVEVSTGGWPGPEYMFNTPEDFDSDLASRNGIIYRNAELYKNDKYNDIAFPIIPWVGEDYPEDEYSYTPEKPYVFNDDICTYGGDYACFREGYRIVLNYNLKDTNSNWQSVELYKDDVLYGTYLLSSDIRTYGRGPANYPIELSESLPEHSFDLSFLDLKYGKYKARLVDGGGNYSDYTYFEIIDTEVSYNIEDGIINIHFNTHNSTPHYVRISRINAGPKCIYEITKDDIENGWCSFDAVDLIKRQYDNIGIDGEILKVYFKGDYGTVTCVPIDMNSPLSLYQ